MHKRLMMVTVCSLLTLVLPGGLCALARAPFPDSTKAQPIPAYVHPNISGNVNTTHTSQGTVSPEVQQIQDESNVPTAVPSDEPGPSGQSNVLVMGVAVVLCLIIVGLFVRSAFKKDGRE